MSPRNWPMIQAAIRRGRKHGSAIEAASDYPRARVEVIVFAVRKGR